MRLLTVFILTLVSAFFPHSSKAAVFLTVNEALKLAFPDCAIERRTVYLTKAQQSEAREKAGLDIPGALVNPYLAMRDGQPVAVAYFDAHTIRTQSQTIMIVIDVESRIQRIEILAFHEPQEYLPRPAWYGQFTGQTLDDELMIKRKIRNMTGATLTSRATLDAVRRVLAIHHLLKDRLFP